MTAGATDQISELIVADVQTLQLCQTTKGLGQGLQVVLPDFQDLQLHQPVKHTMTGVRTRTQPHQYHHYHHH